MSHARRSIALMLVCVAACVEPAEPTTTPLGRCGTIRSAPIAESRHVEVGSEIVWPSNPPTSGDHYPMWAGYERLYTQLERGFWLHSVEHGGVALLFNCPGECADIVDGLVAIVRALPRDPHCAPPLRTRTLIAADPLLDDGVQVAAVAWGTAYTATCFDEASLVSFVADHYGRSAENFCADGLPLTGTALTALP